jgi:hypothetical protein
MKANFSAGELSYQEFCQWLSYNPILIKPLHLLQIKLKKKLMGEKFWLKKTIEREKNMELNDLSFLFKFKELIKVKNFQFKEYKNQLDLIEMEQKYFEDANNKQQLHNHNNITTKEEKTIYCCPPFKSIKKNFRWRSLPILDRVQNRQIMLKKVIQIIPIQII